MQINKKNKHMKHIKLFEQFVNENKETSLEDLLSKYMITFED
jgi:hypothetical protein